MKHVKRQRWLSAIALVAIGAFTLLPILVQAQPAPPSASSSTDATAPPQEAPPLVLDDPPPPPEEPPPPPAPISAEAQAFSQQGPATQATVTQYLMNPQGEVDGLLLSDGTQVHFPPHMSTELVAAIKPNDPVNVQGVWSFATPVIRAFVITNVRTGQSVVEHEPSGRIPPFMRRWSMSEMRADGTIQSLLYAPRGELNGALLEDGTQVHVAPHIGYQLSGLLQVGQAISAEGYGTANEFGRSLEAAAIGTSRGAMTPIYGPPGPQRGR